jgi:two-component system cell cycle sensor histidine kinase/response regulator CckA
MKILIVDDNADNQYMLRSLLKGFGQDVIEAADGKEALDKLKEECIDLIISDILMPVMDGFSLCWEVKKAPCFQHIPFIIYTATYTGAQDEALALELGANRFIVKPCEPEELIKTIEEVAGEIQSHDITKIPLLQTEEEILKLYNERLVRKLEQKMLQAEEEAKARKEAMDALNRSEALLIATQSISKIGGWEWDIETQGMFWTQETYRIFDLEPSEDGLKGTDNIQKGMQCYAEEDRPRIAEAFRNCVENGIPYDLECKLVSVKGRNLHVRTAGKPIYEGDKITKVFGDIQDITDIKKSELEKIELLEQLRRTQKLESIGQLAGGVAHDFNNILAVMLGYSEEILSTLKTEDPIFNDMEEIIKAGKKALSLTRQLLTFSRKHLIQPQVLNLNTVIQDMTKMLVRLIGEDVGFTTVFAPELLNIKADIAQIEQVLMNLVINAREAMPSGGKLCVETANVVIDKASAEIDLGITPGDYVMLSVADTGCGMNKETSNRIFEPFFTTKHNGKGTGLGLSTVYGIVKQSDGIIRLDSTLGQGTTFKILFPKTDDEPVAISPEPSALELRGNGEYIVIIEDDTAMGILAQKMLRKLGYKVTLFENADEAILNIVDRGLVPDLIITDVIMPGMNGKELADILLKTLPDLRVLFMSGYTDSVIVDHCMMEFDASFIQKPFTKENIAIKIKQLLKNNTTNIVKPAKIIMIDDDENILELYNRAFNRKGHQTTSAGSLKDALEELSKHVFDVALVDMNIPGTDGISIIQAIRNAGYSIPVIILSGAIDCIDAQELESLGVIGTHEKSGNILPLIEEIESIIEC